MDKDLLVSFDFLIDSEATVERDCETDFEVAWLLEIEFETTVDWLIDKLCERLRDWLVVSDSTTLFPLKKLELLLSVFPANGVNVKEVSFPITGTVQDDVSPYPFLAWKPFIWAPFPQE